MLTGRSDIYISLITFSFSGAVGGICALANILGQECCDLATLCQEGRLEEARELQLKLIAPNQAVRNTFLKGIFDLQLTLSNSIFKGNWIFIEYGSVSNSLPDPINTR